MKSSLFLPLVIALSGLAVSFGVPPPLEPYITKYSQERQALDEARVRQLEALRTRYAAALTTARVEALKLNKSGALVAIDAEIAGVKAEVHTPTAPPDLPPSLAGARREFVAGFSAAEKAVGLRIKDLNTKYLQVLTTLGQQAESQKNSVLASAVATEKARVLTVEAASATLPLRKNVIVNGDFSSVESNGMPTGWQPKGTDYQGDNPPWQNDATVIQEGSEKFLRFRRVAAVRLSNVGPSATILVPERAKEVVVSVRMRVEGLLPGNKYDRYPGISVKAVDASGNSPGPMSASAADNTRWRVFTVKLVLQPGAKKIDVSLGPCAAVGICDFDDVTVKFE